MFDIEVGVVCGFHMSWCHVDVSSGHDVECHSIECILGDISWAPEIGVGFFVWEMWWGGEMFPDRWQIVLEVFAGVGHRAQISFPVPLICL